MCWVGVEVCVGPVHSCGHEINTPPLQTNWVYLKKNDSLSISLSLLLLEADLSYIIVQVVPFFPGSQIQIGVSAELQILDYCDL